MRYTPPRASLATMTKLTDYMNLRDAAAYLGLKEITLRLQIGRGKLKADKLGGRDWWVTLRELNRYRAEHMRVKK